MIAITHFRDSVESPIATAGPLSDDRPFAARAEDALAALAGRPGYLRGSLSRSMDDPADWLLLTEWASVGAYRRALGGFEVKVAATPLLAQALDLPSGFETLVDIAPDGRRTVSSSDRDDSGLGRAPRFS